MTLSSPSSAVKPALSLNEGPVAVKPRVAAGLVRRAERVALAVRLDASTSKPRHDHPMAVVDVSKRTALRMIRQQYRRPGITIDVCDLFGTLCIG
jgi:hypothetical protein